MKAVIKGPRIKFLKKEYTHIYISIEIYRYTKEVQ